MNFGDDLQDMLEDTDYVPSFAARQPKKPAFSKPKNIQQKPLLSSKAMPDFENLSAQRSQPPRKGLFGLHKEAAKKQPTTFEDFFSNQNDTKSEQKNEKKLSQNSSFKNLQIKKDKEEDTFSVFSASRTGMRPPTRSRQKDDTQTESIQLPRRGMMPPLSKKAHKRQDTDLGNNSSMDIKQQTPFRNKNQSNTLNPLQDLAFQEAKQTKKAQQDQLDFQKKSMERILQEQRQSHKKQIEKLKQLHQQELIKKLELKDYQISKVKEFYEVQLSIKNQKADNARQLNYTQTKVQENMRELKKIQQKISDQYSLFENKKRDELGQQQQRKLIELQTKENSLRGWQKRLEQVQKSLKEDKERLYTQQDQEREHLNNKMAQTNKREIDLQSEYRRKQKNLSIQFDRKREQLNRQQQQLQQRTLQLQKQQHQQAQNERALRHKNQEIEEHRKKITNELHERKTSLMEKQIELAEKLNSIAIKEREIDMLRTDLVNRAKLLELEKKKLEIQSHSKLDKTLNRVERRENNFMKTQQVVGGYENYHKSISQMRDQLLRSLPKFV